MPVGDVFDVGTIKVADFVYINWWSVNKTVELSNSFFCVVLDRAVKELMFLIVRSSLLRLVLTKEKPSKTEVTKKVLSKLIQGRGYQTLSSGYFLTSGALKLKVYCRMT